MNKTRDNHFVAQWYQKGFMEAQNNQLCFLTRRDVELKSGENKTVYSKRWHTPAQQFYKTDLYSIFLGEELNDDIEHKLFGPIDDNGSKAVRAFLTDDISQWHHNFTDLFVYIDAQKFRTPKGLDWVQSKYPKLTQLQLMMEMQSLRSIHCTLWGEGVREFVSAENSDVKFIVSDHPVTVYNYACSPGSDLCEYPNEPDIALKGSQTIFPLNKNRCLILTNLEYARDPDGVNPLEQRTNSIRVRQSLVNTIEFINTRKLEASEVVKINHIIKSRAKNSVAAGKDEWLYPENDVDCDWASLRSLLLPPADSVHKFGGEMFARFDDGFVHYQDAFGRTEPPNDFLRKSVSETRIGRNDSCGCGSGRKYKKCCKGVDIESRATWEVASIRERNLAFCNCIRNVLGLDSGKTWVDVRRELSDDQIAKIYGFYSRLWPRDTDIYALLPKPDGRFRALYTGVLDVRTIGRFALPAASIFEEFLIESPIVNPINIKSEFNPVESPGKYKYQALKDFLFMLEMEPFIGSGLVSLVPSPAEFDQDLMLSMFEMARARSQAGIDDVVRAKDERLCFRLMTEDFLNAIAMMPRNGKIDLLVHEFKMSESDAEKIVAELEGRAESSPFMMLQQLEPGKSGQFIKFNMGPNYEMSLFLAQVTDSVLITDSDSRWQELGAAQHRNQGIVSYPWSTILQELILIPIDLNCLKTFRKSDFEFARLRDLVRSVDCMILNDERDPGRIKILTGDAVEFTRFVREVADPDVTFTLCVLSPDGGIYDANVQRLLVRSGCLKYVNKVRSIYGVAL